MATVDGAKYASNNVLNARLREEIASSLSALIGLLQSTHNAIDSEFEFVKTQVSGGESMTRADLESALAPLIEEGFGDDPLARLVLKALSSGENIF